MSNRFNDFDWIGQNCAGLGLHRAITSLVKARTWQIPINALHLQQIFLRVHSPDFYLSLSRISRNTSID